MKILFATLALIVGNICIAQNSPHGKLKRMRLQGTFKGPEFPGGEKKWIVFVQKNFNASIINDDLAGDIKEFRDTLELKFIVTKDSTLQSPQTTLSTSPHFHQAIFDMLSRSPKWIPATRNEVPVNATKFYRFIYTMIADVSSIEVITISGIDFNPEPR